MSRNLKTIIVIVTGIVLMVIALVALSCDSCGDDASLQTSGSDAVSSSDSGIVSELSGVHLHYNESGELLMDGGELESLRLISDKGDYFISYDGNGELTIDSLSGLLLETTFLDMAWYNAHSFGYSYSIHAEEGGINLADFGLDPAVLTVECKYADGRSCRLFVGNEVTGSPSIYYFQFEGRDEVFLNEFDLSFFQGDTYWLSDDIFGDDAEEVNIGTIKLSGAAFDDEAVLEPHSASDKSDPYYGSKYIFTEPFRCSADNYLVTLLTDELTELVADEAVCAFPTKEELTAYGLYDPDIIIAHQRNGAEHVLRVSKHDASTLYAKADGVDCVFQLSADSFSMIAALTTDLLRAPEVHVRYFDAIESIRVQSGDEDYLFRMERTPLATDETLYEYRAYFGDTKLTLNYYKYLLEVFNSATSVSYGSQRESDTPVLTITINYYDELDRDSEVIRYYPAGTRRYLLDMDGDTGIIVGQMWLDKMLESARLLSENKEITP